MSTTPTNTLTYSRCHAVMYTITYTPYTQFGTFWLYLRLAGFVSQATILYKCLFDILTQFWLLEPESTVFLPFEVYTLSANYSSSSLLLARLPECWICICLWHSSTWFHTTGSHPHFDHSDAYTHLVYTLITTGRALLYRKPQNLSPSLRIFKKHYIHLITTLQALIMTMHTPVTYL